MPICIQTYHTEGAFPLSPLKTFQTSRTPSENRSQKQVLSALLYKKWLRRAWCSHMIIKRPFPGSAVVGNTLKVFLLMSLPSFLPIHLATGHLTAQKQTLSANAGFYHFSITPAGQLNI